MKLAKHRTSRTAGRDRTDVPAAGLQRFVGLKATVSSSSGQHASPPAAGSATEIPSWARRTVPVQRRPGAQTEQQNWRSVEQQARHWYVHQRSPLLRHQKRSDQRTEVAGPRLPWAIAGGGMHRDVTFRRPTMLRHPRF